MRKEPKNITFSPALRAAAEQLIAKRRKDGKSYSFSKLVEDAVLAKVRKAGIRLPQEFALKKEAA